MQRTRVMIVEDSAVVCQFLQYVINSDPRLQVVAAVDNAERALQLLPRVAPDVISMDIHLPGMDGLEATRRVMEERPTPIVVVSGCTEMRDLKTSIRALRAGALSVVEKPVGTSHADYEALSERLCTQLAIMSQVKVIRQRFNSRGERATPENPPRADAAHLRHLAHRRKGAGAFEILGIVASTGGPSALQTVLNDLGPDFPLPVAIVQHITTSFHDGFCSWLNDVSPLPVSIATAGELPQPGKVYVAPADRHLEFHGANFLLTRTEPVSAQRPSGTNLFKSMAANFGSRASGVLLTGMGDDGAIGLRALNEAGGYTFAEDRSTAVVYGMPAAAVRLGAVCEEVPLFDVGRRVNALVRSVAEPVAATISE